MATFLTAFTMITGILFCLGLIALNNIDAWQAARVRNRRRF